jgi:hypothetical protein
LYSENPCCTCGLLKHAVHSLGLKGKTFGIPSLGLNGLSLFSIIGGIGVNTSGLPGTK